MSAFADIRAKLDADTPEMFHNNAGEITPIVGDERQSMLDTWAQNVIDATLLELRQQRDSLLAESDWTQNPDAPVDTKAWGAYRQALRDLPAKTKDPREPVWPSKP